MPSRVVIGRVVIGRFGSVDLFEIAEPSEELQRVDPVAFVANASDA